MQQHNNKGSSQEFDYFLNLAKIRMEENQPQEEVWRTRVGARYNRFKDAPWFLNPNHTNEALVIGAGGIGSYLCFCLARMGITPIVYDFDKVETHNLGGQMYPTSSVGKPKIDTLADMLDKYSSIYPSIFYEAYDEEGMTHKYTFTALDNIKTRKEAFYKWNNEHGNDPTAIFIDGRLTFEQLQIFCIVGTDFAGAQEYVNNHLPDDSTIEDAPCTMRQTSHTAMMIASHMTAFFTNHLTNVVEGQKTRPVPFFWEFLCPLNYVTQIQSVG